MSIVRVIVIALCIEIVAFLAGCFGDYCNIIYCRLTCYGMMI